MFSAKKAPPPPAKPKGRVKKRSSFATKLFFVWPLYLAVASGEALSPGRELVRVLEAELGPDAGLVGAGFVAFEALDADEAW